MYAYGTEIKEMHKRTNATFRPWVQQYCDRIDWSGGGMSHGTRTPGSGRAMAAELFSLNLTSTLNTLNHLSAFPGGVTLDRLQTVFRPGAGRDCEHVAADVIRNMFFSNFFATRVAFWLQPAVMRLLYEIDRTGNIYAWRWGDAPITTAAVRLFAAKGTFARMKGLAYVHTSTANIIEPGHRPTHIVVDKAKIEELVIQQTLDPSWLRDHAAKVVDVHHDLWLHNLIHLANTQLIPDAAAVVAANFQEYPERLIIAAEAIGVMCDGAGRLQSVWLMPSVCCCELDTWTENAQDQARRSRQSWINMMRALCREFPAVAAELGSGCGALF